MAYLYAHNLVQAEQTADNLFSDPPSPATPPPAQLPPSSAKPLVLPALTSTNNAPKLPRRAPNGHVKIAEMPSRNIASGSGISTKQRLAQGALAPTRPNEVPLPSQKERPQVPPIKTSSSSLMNLSFKKKNLPASTGGSGFFAMDDSTIPDSAGNPAQEQLTLTALNAPVSPEAPYPELPHTFASPVDFMDDEPTPTSAGTT